MFDLSGKIAVITGGSRGLGLGLAEVLGAHGATPILMARKADELAAAVAHLAELGITAHAMPANLANGDMTAELVADVVGRHGRIDILVNNAGTSWGAPAEEQTPDQWTKVVDLNMNAVWFMTQAVAKQAMIPARRGRILNIASIEGLLGHHPSMLGMIGYSTAKGGVIQMTRALAAEWGRYGIAINALAPGYFLTKLTQGTIAKYEQHMVDTTPLGRIGTIDDMKGPALLLCSEAGRHITGHTLVVDGGATII